MRLAAVLALGLAAVAAVWVGAGCAPHRMSEAIGVLEDIAAGGGPSPYKAAKPAPHRRPTTFVHQGRTGSGDLYVPGEPALAGMVLVPGAAETGKDDARLVAFAFTFARARFEVLVPDLASMRALRLTSQDARILADAALHLHRRAPSRPLGMTAISFAVGPATLALFEPEVADAVDFLIAVGGYYDIAAAITFVTTGSYRSAADEPWRFRRPNEYGKWVFAVSNASRLPDAEDGVALERLARIKLRDPGADVSDDAARLGPGGRAVYALLTNRDPDRVPALLDALPEPVRREIDALDLKSRDLGRLDTEFILIHGRDDPILPETESMALAAAPGPGRARLYLLDSLRHVDPGTPGLGDSLTLLSAVYRVLGLRDTER